MPLARYDAGSVALCAQVTGGSITQIRRAPHVQVEVVGLNLVHPHAGLWARWKNKKTQKKIYAEEIAAG
jgi:hypothetical protein